jgi:hypothetical protein
MTSTGTTVLSQRLKHLTANTLSKISLLPARVMEVGILFPISRWDKSPDCWNSHYGGRSILGQLLSLLSLNGLNLTMILNSVQPLMTKVLILSPPGMSSDLEVRHPN